jgi:hypothetical protein
MKKLALAMLLAAVLTFVGTASAALSPVPKADAYDDSQSHPLRVVAYLIYPVGYTLEWLVFRPFHLLISQPTLAPVFGHRDHSEDASIGSR